IEQTERSMRRLPLTNWPEAVDINPIMDDFDWRLEQSGTADLCRKPAHRHDLRRPGHDPPLDGRDPEAVVGRAQSPLVRSQRRVVKRMVQGGDHGDAPGEEAGMQPGVHMHDIRPARDGWNPDSPGQILGAVGKPRDTGPDATCIERLAELQRELIGSRAGPHGGKPDGGLDATHARLPPRPIMASKSP